MADRLPELREIVTRDYEEMRSFIERIPEDAYGRKTGNGWTVSQMAGHIAASPKGDIFVFDRLSKGKSASLPGPLTFLVDVMNWWGARPFKNTTKTNLLQAMEEAHNERFAKLNMLTEEDLDKGGEVLSMGKLTAYEYIQRSGEHSRGHAEEIRKAVAI